MDILEGLGGIYKRLCVQLEWQQPSQVIPLNFQRKTPLQISIILVA